MQWNERSAEWVRNEVPFGNWMVDEGEHIYYTLEPAEDGRPAAEDACRRSGCNPARASSSAARRRPQAARLAAADQAGLPAPAARRRGLEADRPAGERRPAGAGDDLPPRARLSRSSSPTSPGSTTRAPRSAYYPGRYEPPNAAVRGPMMVPDDQRSRLLATFNGGFTYIDGDNGSADNGRTNEPLKDGNATLIGYRDGRVAIVKWSGGPDVGPGRRVGPPEPGADRLERAAEPAAGRRPEQPAVGLHARRRHPRLAHRRRHRPSRQPHLRRRQRPDGDHAREDPPARRCGAGDGVRHQPRMAHVDHLHPRRTVSSRRWSGPTRCSRPTATSSPTTVTSSPSTCPARSGHRSLQVRGTARLGLAVVDVRREFTDGSGERLGGFLRDQVPDSRKAHRGDLARGYLAEGLLGERGAGGSRR